ncbi:MAG: phage tail protein [Rubrivivax sp.]|nr:phage tail protein [Rubrivivax sp.]MDP3224957.1 phage tail protein [Rubrivivax sp.]MDP3612306.1 phage tail protein [Rubrivivax sp.]
MFLPPLGFHFKVEVLGLSNRSDDLRFTEVSGLSFEVAAEEVPEGGENRFVQKYPGRTKYADLVLKRGLLKNSEVWNWLERSVDTLEIEPKDVDVTLLNEAHEPLMTWHLVMAWPVKWSVSDLNATNNAFLVESLQLSYQYFRFDKS